MKSCVIPNCSKKEDSVQYFPFPKDLKLLDQWISKMPLLNFTSMNFKTAEICVDHFGGSRSRRKLRKDEIPEYFPTNEEIDGDCCRFCLKKNLAREKLPLDDLVKTHYQNLMQEELNMNYPQLFSCVDCFYAIRNSSHIKLKILENQMKLAKMTKSEQIDIKMEIPEFDAVDVPAHSEEKTLIKEESEEDTKKFEKSGNVSESEESEEESKDLEWPYNNLAKRWKDHKKKPKVEMKWCEICRVKLQDLDKHNQLWHQNQYKLECDLCGQRYPLKYSMSRHMVKVHQVQKKYKCKVCFAEQGDKCNIFNNKAKLRWHIKFNHLKVTETICEICAKSFLSAHRYRQHYMLHHTKEKPYKCDHCGFASVTKLQIKSHISHMHSTKTIPCRICGKAYKTKNNMEKHIIRKHVERAYVCTFEGCKSAYSFPFQLDLHQKKHLNIRNYSCNLCGASYFNTIALRNHVLSIHMNVIYNCPVPNCTSKSNRKNVLKKHAREKHQNLDSVTLQRILETINKMKVPKIKPGIMKYNKKLNTS